MTSEQSIVSKVEDENGRQYTLSGKSWTGGQGQVVVDSTGKYIIKLSKKRSSESREKIRQQIQRVRLMPIDDLPVTRPLALLRPPFVGYVMEYLTGMEPIQNLMKPSKEIWEDSDKLLSWYNKSGGLNRRLDILAKLATILYRLHSKGLSYGDLSPNNVFVSSSIEQSQVYLIDIDNLNYESSAGGSFIQTGFYSAPEVITLKHGVDTLSDAYSFSVIAFETLTLCHPLLGDYVVYGDPDLEYKAQIGEIPWIFHSCDDSNFSSHVLPKELVLSDGLIKLFQSNFEEGMTNPKERPGMKLWERALHTAERFTLVCPNCHGSYYHRNSICPWCKSNRPSFLIGAVDDHVIFIDSEANHFRTNINKNESGFCVQYPSKFAINRRLLGFNDVNAEKTIIEINIDENLLVQVRNLEDQECWAVHEDWKYEDGIDNGKKKIKITSSPQVIPWTWQIHIGSLTRTHPAIRFIRK